MKLIKKVRVLTRINPYTDKRYYQTLGVYKCKCGNVVWVKPRLVKIHSRTSCGCLLGGFVHGMARKNIRKGSSLYNSWCAIKQRCYNPKQAAWHRYGGRGIKMCVKWARSFIAFYEWGIQNGWKPGLSIERKNNDAGYYPKNCCFIPRKRQARNRYTNKLTLKKVRRIRYLYDAGLARNCDLAKMYKITPTTMCKIVHRRIWKEDSTYYKKLR